MFAFLRQKQCSQGVIFAVNSDLLNYLGTPELHVCLRVFIFAI